VAGVTNSGISIVIASSEYPARKLNLLIENRLIREQAQAARRRHRRQTGPGTGHDRHRVEHDRATLMRPRVKPKSRSRFVVALAIPASRSGVEDELVITIETAAMITTTPASALGQPAAH
jgi:hypothetical protein